MFYGSHEVPKLFKKRKIEESNEDAIALKKSCEKKFTKLSKTDPALETREGFLVQQTDYANLIDEIPACEHKLKGHSYYNIAVLKYRFNLYIEFTKEEMIFEREVLPYFEKAIAEYQKMEDKKLGEQYIQETQDYIQEFKNEFSATIRKKVQQSEKSQESQFDTELEKLINRARENGITDDVIERSLKKTLKANYELTDEESSSVDALMSLSSRI